MKLSTKALMCGAALASFTQLAPEVNAQCAPGSGLATLDVNNANATVGIGYLWNSGFNPGYEIPAGNDAHTMYTAGLWIGGTDINGQLKIAASTYDTGFDFFPGPLESPTATVTPATCSNYDRHWVVYKSEIDAFISSGGTNIATSISEWPAIGNPNLGWSITQDMAPFIDANSDGLYNPADGDYPKIKGDQAIWWVFNDQGNVHTNTGGDPIGVQIRAMAYAYQTNDAINNTTFYEFTIDNMGTQTINDTYLGFFADCDLGNYDDDYVGCDSTRNLGIAYNGDPLDENNGPATGYGSNPPIAGVDMVGLPKDENGNSISMSSFVSYSRVSSNQSITDPVVAADYYNYLQALWKDGSHVTYGGSGYGGTTPSNYMFPSAPSDSTGWSECAEGNPAGDRRFLMNFGPFTLAPGGGTQFTIAKLYYGNTSSDNCDLSGFAAYDDQVQAFYDSVCLGITTGVGDIEEMLQVSIYPNPSEGQLTVEMGQEQGQLTLTDLAGKVVYTGRLEQGDNQLQLNDLAGGVYLVHIVAGERQYAQKLILR